MAPEERMLDFLTPMNPQPTSMTAGGQLKEKVTCVLFDIYGTLFISGSGDIGVARKKLTRARKVESLLRKCNIRKTPRHLAAELIRAIEAEHRRLRAEGFDYPEIKIDEIWKQILAIDDLEFIRRFAIEYELIVNPVYPMPNLAKLLAACRKQNLTLGIISNAQFFTPLLFEWFLNTGLQGLGFHPELIFLSYRLGYAKPSMVPFEKAAAAIKAKGFDTMSALYVGNDMLNDIYPAHRQGFQTALFAGDARSLRLRADDPRCFDLSADIVLTDLDQLIHYF